MIRAATLADLPGLAAIHAACFADNWNAESLGLLLASPGAFALVAEQGGAPAGFVLARGAAGEAEILTLAVANSARRGGMGTALIAASALRAAENGAVALFLEVATGNLAARALYGRLGFAQAGLRKGYYKGALPEDALVLRAALPLEPLGKVQPVD
jgi:ribosomal-protein-alanine N-acetyltransferase